MSNHAPSRYRHIRTIWSGLNCPLLDQISDTVKAQLTILNNELNKESWSQLHDKLREEI